MGRKRAYAPLDVYMNRRKVGQYFRDPDGAFSFTYAPEWLAWENTLPISRSLPLRAERYVGQPVIAVFENLLPDSDDIRRRVPSGSGRMVLIPSAFWPGSGVTASARCNSSPRGKSQGITGC